MSFISTEGTPGYSPSSAFPSLFPAQDLTNGQDPEVSPVPNTPVSGTVYQNTLGKPIFIYGKASITTAAGTVAISYGNPQQNTAPSALETIGGSGQGIAVVPFFFILLPGWYIKFVNTTATTTLVQMI